MDEKREPLDILMADFIDEKSARAKGKRVTTLDVASIEDITPEALPESEEPDPEEPEPEEEGFEDAPDTSENTDASDTPESSDAPESIDVEGVTMTFEKPVDTQLDLF